MANFARFGNNLYTGETSLPFIRRKKLWLSLAAVLVVVSLLIPLVGGLKLGIDFRGGSEFTVSDASNESIKPGQDAVAKVRDSESTEVVNIAPRTIRVQTDQLDDEQTLRVKTALQQAYRVGPDEVTSSFVGPAWGAGVTRQAAWGLVAFVVLATVLMALYFRTVKMSLSAIAGLVFTVVTTLGVYAAFGFQITPSAIIGFLTILSYSLYDSVVVFDKIRENTEDFEYDESRSYAQQVELAVNQTLVRSINTSVVGILPVGSILFIGAMLLGAGTLQDLSLSLFIGIIMGTIGTLFVSAPLYALLRQGEKKVRAQARALETGDFADMEQYRRGRVKDKAAGREHASAEASFEDEADSNDMAPVPPFEPRGKDRPDSGAVV